MRRQHQRRSGPRPSRRRRDPGRSPSPSPKPHPKGARNRLPRRRHALRCRLRSNPVPPPEAATAGHRKIRARRTARQSADRAPVGWFEHWKYLTPSVRAEIDRAPVLARRWRYIVVHNSGTRQGNAKAFDYYHLHVRRMPNGLAYHFVVGTAHPQAMDRSRSETAGAARSMEAMSTATT